MVPNEADFKFRRYPLLIAFRDKAEGGGVA